MSLVQMLMWSGVITDNNVRSLLVCGDLDTCHRPRTGNPRCENHEDSENFSTVIDHRVCNPWRVEFLSCGTYVCVYYNG